jgi:phosphohistidine phosphatase
MKTLILVRHAKSSWDNPDIKDFERPLNKRGKKDAPLMAKIFKDKNIVTDLIISSPAVRAFSTAQEFAEELKYPKNEIITDISIYEMGSKAILNILSKLNPKYKVVMLFGHNPDMTYLSSYLSGNNFDNVPTCGVVCIDFEIDSWDKITDNQGTLRFFEYPKKY